MAVGDSIGYNLKHEKLSDLNNIINNDTDIFIFNLEGVLAEGDSSSLSSVSNSIKCKGFPSFQSTFVTESTFIDYLKLAPITIANLANNHILDCGTKGIKETKKILMEKDILSVGAGQNLKDACKPLLIQPNEDLKIVFVSYNFVLEDLVLAQTNSAGAATIDSCNHDYNKIRLEAGADLVIASIHLGSWSSNVNNEQIDVVRHLFDSGIDIVIGHSPHMPQAIGKTTTTTKDEWRTEKLAFFSLGNFILRPEYVMPSKAYTTIVPKLDINTENNLANVKIYPVRIGNDGIPYLEEKGNGNNEIISKIAKDSEEKFDTSIKINDNIGQLSVNLQKYE
jgi:poly-gamma-glutamate synthesis protein (capsule biosynthesis protein)